ncbi:MAG: glycosyltransferase family 39 protein [Patescibacteria group bacterium]|nr:glycosyltransferase family 39 protein [Patescibacteria group bacterium]
MKNKIVLSLIILLGFILRIYHIHQLPSILNRDEAALAYNGLLIAQTGKDEWQQTLPLVFKSFGDYKLPGYIYTLSALFSFLPATDFVVRLPSVLAGTGLIILTYLYAKKLKLSDQWSLFAAMFMAVTPIFIFYSRMAWEANLALFFLLSGLYLLLFNEKKKKNKQRNDFIGLALILVASFTYNTPWLYLPFLLPLVYFFRKTKKKQDWQMPVFGLAVIFVIGFVLFQAIAQQKSGITIFTDETLLLQYGQYRQNFSPGLKLIFGNRYIFWLTLIFKNFLASFSPSYLIFKGGNHPWHNLPHHGHLYISTYLLGLVGSCVVAKNIDSLLKKKKATKKQKIKLKHQIFLICTLIFSLAPAVVTVDAPHATRSLLFFFIFTLLSIYGFKFTLKLAKKQSKTLLTIIFVAVSIETALYFNQYFVEYPQQQQAYKPGFDIIAQSLNEKFPQESVAVVADGYQYILAAWYLKISPEEYFTTNVRQNPDKIGLSYGEQVINYHFIADKSDRSEKERILVFWDENNNQWQVERY